MNTDSVHLIRERLEIAQEEILKLRQDVEKLTVWTGEASQNLLEAEIYIEAALDDVCLVLR